MAPRKISAKDLLGDLRRGLPDAEIMKKHQISPNQLAGVIRKMQERGFLKSLPLDGDGNRLEQPAEQPGSKRLVPDRVQPQTVSSSTALVKPKSSPAPAREPEPSPPLMKQDAEVQAEVREEITPAPPPATRQAIAHPPTSTQPATVNGDVVQAKARTPLSVHETRQCPYCAEDIRVGAKKCKHCGEFLEPGGSEIRRQHEGQEELGEPICTFSSTVGVDSLKGFLRIEFLLACSVLGSPLLFLTSWVSGVWHAVWIYRMAKDMKDTYGGRFKISPGFAAFGMLFPIVFLVFGSLFGIVSRCFASGCGVDRRDDPAVQKIGRSMGNRLWVWYLAGIPGMVGAIVLVVKLHSYGLLLFFVALIPCLWCRYKLFEDTLSALDILSRIRRFQDGLIYVGRKGTDVAKPAAETDATVSINSPDGQVGKWLSVLFEAAQEVEPSESPNPFPDMRMKIQIERVRAGDRGFRWLFPLFGRARIDASISMYSRLDSPVVHKKLIHVVVTFTILEGFFKGWFFGGSNTVHLKECCRRVAEEALELLTAVMSVPPSAKKELRRAMRKQRLY